MRDVQKASLLLYIYTVYTPTGGKGKFSARRDHLDHHAQASKQEHMEENHPGFKPIRRVREYKWHYGENNDLPSPRGCL